MSRSVPRLLVSAAAAGQGKTAVKAAPAHHGARQGLRVGMLKTPDVIDPMILARAALAGAQTAWRLRGGGVPRACADGGLHSLSLALEPEGGAACLRQPYWLRPCNMLRPCAHRAA